jgi:hypothetical protein
MNTSITSLALLSALSSSTLASTNALTIKNSNVRQTPSFNSKILKVIKTKTKVEILYTVLSKSNKKWYKLNNGYVYQKNIIRDRDNYSIPTNKVGIYLDGSKIKNTVQKQEALKVPVLNVPVLNVPTKKPVNHPTDSKATSYDHSKFFVGLSLGLSALTSSYEEKNGSFTKVREADESALNYTFELGYFLNKTLFTSLSYNQMNFDDATLYNYSISINKAIEFNYINVYAGLTAGVSFIDISKSPIQALEAIDIKGRSNLYGAQIGVQYDYSKRIKFFTQYQYLKLQHDTNLLSGTSKVIMSRENYSNMDLGVRYLLPY